MSQPTGTPAQQVQSQGQSQQSPPGKPQPQLSDLLLERVREANAQSAANLLSKGGGGA